MRVADLTKVILLLSLPTIAQWGQGQETHPPTADYKHHLAGIGWDSKGDWAKDGGKIGSDLWLLLDQLAAAPISTRAKGVNPVDPNISGVHVEHGVEFIDVVVKLEQGARSSDVRRYGAILSKIGSFVFMRIDTRKIRLLAQDSNVQSISLEDELRRPQGPENRSPKPLKARGDWAPSPVPGTFDHSGFTGKGVIVAIIDTGIDWRHPDFIDANGKSRVLELWDLSDDSYKTKQIGSPPPVEALGGTLYTRDQINAALSGKGVVNSTDKVGHGTACAGLAAGNGRAEIPGMPQGTYKGVAPEADLIVCKVADDKGIFHHEIEVAGWVAEEAKRLKQPVVINLSCGSQGSAHDGDDKDEQALNELTGNGIPGIAICVAAGNERIFGLHASGYFSPAEDGVTANADMKALQMHRDGHVIGVFAAADEWGLDIEAADGALFGIDKLGKPLSWRIYWQGGQMNSKLKASDGTETDAPAEYSRLFETESDGVTRTLDLLLPGKDIKYLITPFGASSSVTSGQFDLYVPQTLYGTFIVGADPKHTVSSPGNAENVITVSAYNYQTDWLTQGGHVHNMFPVGDLAEYSNSGYRRVGDLVKPDIVAPGTFAISALADGADDIVGGNPSNVLPGGKYVAWQGTSAATPYVAGVVALMLQKNPRLDGREIQKYIISTADHDRFTGGVPNTDWGNGKLDPERALRATPAAS